ncbi:MAG: AGE family epimerase/isomerase [Lachnospirales bacterium]
MLTNNNKFRLLGFYENELTNNLLHFWLERCVDEKNGGFFNCFDNTGCNLISTDKYIWSQGRFVWVFASLATMKSDTFTSSQREKFKKLARHGIKFLREFALISPNDLRCLYLVDEKGSSKKPKNYNFFDASIYADCFVALAFAKVAHMDTDLSLWNFAKSLYNSVNLRLKNDNYHTFPYPMGHEYRAHGIPMIMTNVETELFKTAKELDKDFALVLKKSLKKNVSDTLDNFVDENNLIREVINSDNTFIENLLGEHLNPGHTIENIWFILDAMEIEDELNTVETLKRLSTITLNTLEIGWDRECGGIFHYVNKEGGMITKNNIPIENEPVLQYALENSGGKIWWVHSEALYTLLRLYIITDNTEFLSWYDKIEDYTFNHFPNPNREIREWVQSLDRFGNAKKEAVGLPVKDPYHITRNVLLIIELLYKNLRKKDSYENKFNVKI